MIKLGQERRDRSAISGSPDCRGIATSIETRSAWDLGRPARFSFAEMREDARGPRAGPATLLGARTRTAAGQAGGKIGVDGVHDGIPGARAPALGDKLL